MFLNFCIMKDRTRIIQEIVNHNQANIYLEIGIDWGFSYLDILCPKKIGVDPRIRIKKSKKFYSYFKNPSNIFNNLYEITSDEFFKTQIEFLTQNGLDVVFIDGLHTYEQSLRDVENSLKYLNKNGLIIMHDVNPASESSTRTAKCGDVWKTIVHLRSNYADLKVFVLNYTHGLGIITKGKPESMLELHSENIKNLSYEFLNNNRFELLNLKNPQQLKELLKSIPPNFQNNYFSKIFYILLKKIIFKLKIILKIYQILP